MNGDKKLFAAIYGLSREELYFYGLIHRYVGDDILCPRRGYMLGLSQTLGGIIDNQNRSKIWVIEQDNDVCDFHLLTIENVWKMHENKGFLKVLQEKVPSSPV